jgi:hypothetical protein
VSSFEIELELFEEKKSISYLSKSFSLSSSSSLLNFDSFLFLFKALEISSFISLNSFSAKSLILISFSSTLFNLLLIYKILYVKNL